MKLECLSDRVSLYHGDCREVIPSLEPVAAVVTDPPYGIQDIAMWYGRDRKTIEGDTTLEACREVFNLLAQHQNNIWLMAFYSCRISPEFFITANRITIVYKGRFNYFGEIIWDKKILGLGTDIRYQHENIAVFKIGEPPDLRSLPSVLSFTRVSGEHPHEKPVQVMENLCHAILGETILDPFMGSGSTGVAAIGLNKKFIGVEIDQKYFDLACKRISNAMKQPKAFWEE